MNRRDEYQDERWKEKAAHIRELDGHKCRWCGETMRPLHVHHLAYPPAGFHLWDSFDEELVTLCEDCHKKVHDLSNPVRLKLTSYRDAYPEMYRETLIDDADILADEADRRESEFKLALEWARSQNFEYCANCFFSLYCGDHLECEKRIEADRDIPNVQPYEYGCSEFEPDEDFIKRMQVRQQEKAELKKRPSTPCAPKLPSIQIPQFIKHLDKCQQTV